MTIPLFCRLLDIATEGIDHFRCGITPPPHKLAHWRAIDPLGRHPGAGMNGDGSEPEPDAARGHTRFTPAGRSAKG